MNARNAINSGILYRIQLWILNLFWVIQWCLNYISEKCINHSLNSGFVIPIDLSTWITVLIAIIVPELKRISSQFWLVDATDVILIKKFKILPNIKPTQTSSTNEFSTLPIWLHHDCYIYRNLCKNGTESK